jgi:hypothetical protein
MIVKKKYYVLIVVLIIFFILILNLFYRKYYEYDNDRENFIGFLELLNYSGNTPRKQIIIKYDKKDKEKEIKKELKKKPEKKMEKYIYIIDKNKDKNIKSNLEYIFLNKNDQPYMTFEGELNLKNIEFILKNNNNKPIGKLDKIFHNKFVVSLSMYSDNINIEFHNNYFNAICYIQGTDYVFYMKYLKKKKDNSEILHIFVDSYKLKIGNIHKENGKWKIKVKDEYKTYLNMFGITFICLNNFQ